MEQISPQQLKARLAGQPPLLLDVREDWERQICHLEHSLHIPMGELEFRAEELDPDTEIVVYCHHGVRSATVVHYLQRLGFRDVKNLAGGLARWARMVDPTMRQY